jgi:drug/metabolite transporter (DMT)-like permease
MRKDHLLLAAPPLIWGSLVVAASSALDRMDAASLTLWTWVLAILLLSPVLFNQRRALITAWRQSGAWLLAIGSLGTTGFQFFWYYGLTRAGAIDVALLTAALPVFICLGEHLTGRRLLLAQWAGLVVAGLGCFFLLAAPIASDGWQFLPGTWAILAANLCMTIYTIALSRPPLALAPLPMLAALSISGLVMFLPITAIFIGASVFGPPPVGDLTLWLELIYIGGGAYVLAYLLWNRSIAVHGPVRTGLFLYLQPIFAIGFAVTCLGDRIGGLQLAAGMMILGGLGFADWMANAPHRPRATTSDLMTGREGNDQ